MRSMSNASHPSRDQKCQWKFWRIASFLLECFVHITEMIHWRRTFWPRTPVLSKLSALASLQLIVQTMIKNCFKESESSVQEVEASKEDLDPTKFTTGNLPVCPDFNKDHLPSLRSRSFTKLIIVTHWNAIPTTFQSMEMFVKLSSRFW